MTASEKLRALERENAIVVVSLDQPLHVAGEPAPASVSLRNVLPLIADEVKAAEDVLHEYHLWSEDANDGEFAIWSREEFMAAFHRLQIAFNALNEALQ